MKENWDKCFALVIKSEGGFVNNPKDPGGMTNLGVTKVNWEMFLNRNVTEAEMRALTPESVKGFYKSQYWDKIKGDQLPSGIDYATFDFAVNSGVSRAIKMLQQIAGVVVDGSLGPKSMEAIKTCNPGQAIDVLCNMRLDFLKRLANFDTFGKGWEIRVAKVKDKASGMA
jgi:lysozyme family protein